MSIIDTLITDRTQGDEERVEELAAKGYDAMTDAEKAEWDGEMKGAYDASDLNRVESAVSYLAELLVLLPSELKEYAASKGVAFDAFFDVPYDAAAYTLATKTDWGELDSPTPEQMERYIENVKALRSALDYATSDLPGSMDNLTIDGANSIEKALKGLDEAISAFDAKTKVNLDNTASVWIYSGEIYASEVLR